jgi:hypothetical protein
LEPSIVSSAGGGVGSGTASYSVKVTFPLEVEPLNGSVSSGRASFVETYRVLSVAVTPTASRPAITFGRRLGERTFLGCQAVYQRLLGDGEQASKLLIAGRAFDPLATQELDDGLDVRPAR